MVQHQVLIKVHSLRLEQNPDGSELPVLKSSRLDSGEAASIPDFRRAI
jgi:hypothetical protein